MNAALRQALSPARCPSGGLRVHIEGEPCVLRCSGALWVLNHRTLIAADLHLEKGSAFAARGQMLPPYDSRATLDRLEAEIDALKPAAVVLLGQNAVGVGGEAAIGEEHRLDALPELLVREEQEPLPPLRSRSLGHASSCSLRAGYVSDVDIPRPRW